MKLKCGFYLCVVVALGLVLAYLSRDWWLTRAAEWLVYSRETSKANVIFVLGGDATERARYAARLYRQGVSPRIVVTGAPRPRPLQALGLSYTEAELSGFVLRSHGVPAAAITVLNRGQSTWNEANIDLDFALHHGYKKVLVVSSPYHMRRASLAFSKVFQGSGIGLYFSPAKPSWFRPQKWWHREEDTLAVFEEYVKLARYEYLYLLRPAPRGHPLSQPAH